MNHESEQLAFKNEEPQADNGPVVCLGMTFKNDDERREYFREELRKKLPELKKIEGFPRGEDEDIIELSDPPYYTACPNPWINDFIDEWEKEKLEKYDSYLNEKYHKVPFTSDVSEGKSDPIYMAHAYHTKVPYKAIMRYILHYTNPGDIVYDGFCGSGMTGVAASYCGDESIVSQLNSSNYEVGERKAILQDLSVAATHISNNYNNTLQLSSFENYFKVILNKIYQKYEWMFETKHQDGSKGYINYIVWSEMFICPNCGNEFSYWDTAVDLENKKIKSEFFCTSCNSLLKKNKVERVFESKYHKKLGKTVNQVKYLPVLINYSVGNRRFEKIPDKQDISLLKNIDEYSTSKFYPVDKLISGDEIDRLKLLKIDYSFQLMSSRNNIIIAEIYDEIKNSPYKNLALFVLSAAIPNLTWLYRWRINKKGGFTSGTYYICSTPQENNPFNQIKRKLQDILKINERISSSVISTQSSVQTKIRDESVDYIFTDPPFGANLMYSELNFLWESWLKIFSNPDTEAIVSKKQKKDESKYRDLMYECFKENFRILKPGKWMTVVFSNSKASVWNAVQESILKAGFVIANVSVLDKIQGSFKAVTTTTAVKQDLVISAYKPKKEDIIKINENRNHPESAWTFITQHLEHLPNFVGYKGQAEIIPERTPRILFDRMVAYHVQNGLPIPVSSAEFQAEVAQRYPMRDGMVFLESQVAEYDKKRTLVKEFAQQSLFVTDENSAIEWIRQQLLKKPQTRQDIHPDFMKELQHIAKHEALPELDELLEQNFLRYDGDEKVPDQIMGYLRKNYKDLRGLEANDPKVIEKSMHRWYVPDPNKQADLERLREKTLLREFDNYLKELEGNKKKLRNFRTEAIRAGFKKAYSEKDFEKIIKVGERIPEKVIQEDDKLLMYYDAASIRLGL